MKQLQTVLIALVALLGLANMAEASADLWTAPLIARTGENAACRLSNITALTHTVQIRIYDFTGTSLFNTGTFLLAPFASYTFETGGPIQFMCRFTVPSKTSMRGAAVVSGVSDKAAVPAQ